MVRINTENGYVISLIQSSLGNNMMMEACVWPNDNSTKEIEIKGKGIDMMFLDENGLIKVIRKVQKLPKIKWV